ncbi:YciI family protein [Amycolatopsis carbonis]|uniref:YciI family protein n=1 Tax=Amycolatopsis carbonis TaxID=715471 RepID=A0A9Y2IFF4_9PSEU|nr:YciI family protein [Amycolatopsis sp. 2-15]WIX78484.1 YciI family protein [Amycolatopsis sp. 2-15]
MVKYLLLIYGDEQIWEAGSAEDRKEIEAGHAAFVAAAGDAVLAGHELLPTATAMSLRGSVAGRPAPTDGPFLESKEVLGGYYVVEAPDLDAAIKLAERLPELTVAHSGVEIRPINEPG